MAAPLFGQAPSLTSPIGNQSINFSAGPTTIDLQGHFTYTGTSNPIARFETVEGDFDVELLQNAAPKHVENFKAYANDGPSSVVDNVRTVRNFDNSFIHRSSSLESKDNLPDIDLAPKVLQGGSFKIDDGFRRGITPKEFVPLEYNQPNARGTLAAARTNDPNSATSGWFFNVADNSTAFAPVNGAGGYTVFGRVIGAGLEVLDRMAAVRRYRFAESFLEFPLRNYTSGPVTDDKLLLINRVRVLPIQPAADGSAPGVLVYSATSTSTGIVEPRLVGRTLELIPRAPGTATVTVSARDARGTPATTTFNVQVTSVGPVITQAPRAQTVAPGGTATFSVTATGTGSLSYQWRKDGSAIAGATGSTLTVGPLTSSHAGGYSVAVTDSTGTTTSAVAQLQVGTPASGALINLSVRSGSHPLIVGFVASGGSKSVLVRAVGPGLTAHGVTNPMADPSVTVQAGGNVIASNNDWGSNAETLSPIFASVGAFPLTDTASKDAAVVASVSGASTAVVEPATGGGGVVLAEVYALSGGTGRLINVSGRGRVGTGANALIAGFAISGNVPKQVLIRGIGPTLGTMGVTNALANPILELYRALPNGTQELVATNDDWGTNPEVPAGPIAGAFALPAGSADSALLLTLNPGVYSAMVRGVGNTTGEALVEVYEVP
jgi:cyclophilin family peptidyl-prolyl cis-trans isomerase